MAFIAMNGRGEFEAKGSDMNGDTFIMQLRYERAVSMKLSNCSFDIFLIYVTMHTHFALFT